MLQVARIENVHAVEFYETVNCFKVLNLSERDFKNPMITFTRCLVNTDRVDMSLITVKQLTMPSVKVELLESVEASTLANRRGSKRRTAKKFVSKMSLNCKTRQ